MPFGGTVIVLKKKANGMLTELIYVGVHMAECIFEFIKVIGVE